GSGGTRRPVGPRRPPPRGRLGSRNSRIARRRLTTRRPSRSMTRMRIVVMGSGGTGGYFGAKLARAGEDVTFVARGAHLAALRASGMRIKSAAEGDWTVRVPAAGHVLGGAVRVFATIEAPGVITHVFGGHLAFGEMDGRETPRAQALL